MRRVCVILLLALSFLSFAQRGRKLDSLLKIKVELNPDTTLIKHYLSLAAEYSKISLDSSMFYSNRAIELARALNNAGFIVKSRFEKFVNQKQKLVPRQLIDTLQILYNDAQFRGNKKYFQSVCYEMGIQYRKISNFDKSVFYLLESLKLAKELQDKKKLYNSYNSLANTYSQAGSTKKSSGDLQRALEMYEQAYHYTDTTKKNVSGMILSNQGVTYFNLGQINSDTLSFRKAINFYKKSLDYRIADGDSIGISDAYGNLGSAYQELFEVGNDIRYLKTADHYYIKSIEIDKLIDHPGYYSHLANYGTNVAKLGKIANDKKQIQEGLAIQKKALAISNAYGDSYTSLMTYFTIGHSFVNLNQADSAVKYFLEHIKLKDSILTRENKQLAEELAAKYESELKESENKNLREQASLREEVISKKNGTIRLMIIASLVMLSLIVLVFLSRQKIRKSKKVIEEQKRKTEEQKLLIEEKQKEILDSINYSKRLQDAAIPSTEFFRSLFPASFIFYQPKDIVAGDFYWIHKTKQSDKILVAAADCTGHGVPGALVSIVCLNALNRCVDEFGLSLPSEILNKATEIIQDSFRQSENDVKDGMDIALCLIDKEAGELIYSGAHNPLWLFRNKELIEVKGDKQPVGKQHVPRPFNDHQLKLMSGDILFLSTDGYADQFGGESGKKMKSKKFKSIIENLSSKNIGDIEKELNNFFHEWKGGREQVDDVLVVGIKI